VAKFISLYSGSKGNACVVLSESGEGVLLDCGVSFTKLKAGLDAAGVPLSALRGVVVTHEHSDHIGGLSVFLCKTGLPVYLNRRTAQTISFALEDAVVSENDPFPVGNIEVRRFPVRHDAAACSGYVFKVDGKKITAMTDCGIVDARMLAAAADSDLLYIESNYDEIMLENGPYPPHLRRRIRSEKGHLSNRECADTVTKLALLGLRKVVLGHVSENNNTYLQAKRCTLDALSVLGLDVAVEVADESPEPLVVEV